MFYSMMTWLFLRKDRERLSRLVAMLMAVIGLESVKDLFFLNASVLTQPFIWSVMTAVDMVAVPMYAFVLIELCRPGWLTLKTMIIHEIPFVILPLLLITTRHEIFYDIEVGWAAVYGFGYAIWTLTMIPRYHGHLKERFSYDENINLNWLRIILFSFFVILGLWIVDCLVISVATESVYMLMTLVIWMFICYFIYRHESVIGELSDETALAVPDTFPEDGMSELNRRIQRLFTEERIFLNPRLKLSDVATLVGTNRTYISNFFNKENGATFYEYINRLRIEYACTLLRDTSDKLETVAEKSGFNSISTFRRAFLQFCGCTPAEYRGGGKRLKIK